MQQAIQSPSARTGAAGARPDLSISCRDINVRFFSDRRSTTAIEGLSLDVPAGEFLTLLGPSGCGKSTFLRVVADLVQPSRGEIKVLNDAPSAARARRDIGFGSRTRPCCPGAPRCRTSSCRWRLPMAARAPARRRRANCWNWSD